jgi:hypothetical protein
MKPSARAYLASQNNETSQAADAHIVCIMDKPIRREKSIGCGGKQLAFRGRKHKLCHRGSKRVGCRFAANVKLEHPHYSYDTA